MRDAKKLVVAMLALVAATALVACGSDDVVGETTGEEGAPVSGEFSLLADAPAGYSEVAGEAEVERTNAGTTVSVAVSGLKPRTPYIAHLHTGGCGEADPGGPHFQFEPGGSEEPPNEIHLRFTSDASGEGDAEATSKRKIPPGEVGSVVLHIDREHEMTASAADGPETIFVHEGVDHSKEEGHHGDQPHDAHGDKIACAELEGGATADAGPAANAEVPTIVVREGEPVGGAQELEYSAGEEIRFRVTSDQAEEIHVHGYDISKEVAAGGTVEFAFPAELEGIYEAELEELGVQIVELRVNP